MTDAGRIEAEQVVNACGIWAPQVAAMVGAFTPSVPVDHQHVTLHAVPGHELPRDTPCFRDTDNLVYGKAESGGVMFGGYEPDPRARWVDGVPWEHGSRPVPADHDRFAQLMDGAVRRFPFLEDAGIVALVGHPDAMTPDGNPLLGPVPGVPGFWMAAGLSLNGFGGAGGLGKAVAELIVAGEAELDVTSYRPWRFGGPYRDVQFATAAACEVYKYYYRLRYPGDVSEAGRPRRLSALHGRLQEAGAVFGTKNGWERADYFDSGRPWRRAGEDQRRFGWTRPPHLDLVAAEHEAMRERVGIVDMSSFGKIEVSGPGALALLERVCDNRIDRAPGSVVYTQFLNERGGIVGDVTVTRLEAERFRVVTGAGAVDSDLGWLRLNVRDADAPVAIRDVTDELAVIGLWGPLSRDVLQSITDGDVSAAALPFRAARSLAVGGATVLVQRITYVGELGYELYVAARAGRSGVGSAGGGRQPAPGRLRGARLAADREGLPLPGNRSDRGRHAVRGGARVLRRARQAGVQRPRRARRRRRAGVEAPHAARRRRGLPHDLRRRGGARRRRGRSGASAAAPTGSPFAATWPSRSCPPRSSAAPPSRSRSSAGSCRPRSPTTCSTTRSITASVHSERRCRDHGPIGRPDECRKEARA